MNKEAEIRKHKGVSIGELKRRWKAVRQSMKERGLDFLIAQNCSPIYCGYVRWFTDMPVSHNPVTVIFPIDDEMTVISHGPRQTGEPAPQNLPPGIKKRLTTPIIHAMEYTNTWDAELAVTELAPYKNCRIGLVGMGFITAAFYNYITAKLSAAKFEIATDLVDDIKAIRSDEEISLTRETCKMHDDLLQYALTCIQPGRIEHEIRTDLMYQWQKLGGEETAISVGSAPAGTAATMKPYHVANRKIQSGDQVVLLMETAGPGGLWGEFSRTICLGKSSPELQEQYELARQTQKVTLDLLRPGADPVALWDANNAFLRKIGYPEERRIYAHGQGYDMMERPSLNPGETIKIQARMNISVHPIVDSAKAHGWVCENYLVTETGEPECLHKTPQKIFVI